MPCVLGNSARIGILWKRAPSSLWDPGQLLWVIPWRSTWAIGVVDSQLAAIRLLPLQILHRIDRALDVDEVGVCKSSGLSSAAIDSDPHIDHVADAAEEVIEVAVRHLERHVADEESLAGRVERLVSAVSAGFHLGGLEGGILNGEAAAFKELLVEGLDGFGSGFGGFEVDVAEPFAQTAAVAHESALGDGAESSEFLYEIVFGDIEEEVANV